MVENKEISKSTLPYAVQCTLNNKYTLYNHIPGGNCRGGGTPVGTEGGIVRFTNGGTPATVATQNNVRTLITVISLIRI